MTNNSIGSIEIDWSEADALLRRVSALSRRSSLGVDDSDGELSDGTRNGMGAALQGISLLGGCGVLEVRLLCVEYSRNLPSGCVLYARSSPSLCGGCTESACLVCALMFAFCV